MILRDLTSLFLLYLTSRYFQIMLYPNKHGKDEKIDFSWVFQIFTAASAPITDEELCREFLVINLALPYSYVGLFINMRFRGSKFPEKHLVSFKSKTYDTISPGLVYQ